MLGTLVELCDNHKRRISLKSLQETGEFISFHIQCIEAQVVISQTKRTGFTWREGEGECFKAVSSKG